VKPFDVTLGGVGAFPDLDDPKVLWIAVERHPALELLANDVEKALQGFGFEPELRPFQPHLTIGRARKDAGRRKIRALDAPAREITYAGVLVVDAIDLMVSRPGKGGSVYRSLRRATLDGH
jgi:2'-5' RNA ligase